jgi:O-antigen/teichoic acid export membrane protein
MFEAFVKSNRLALMWGMPFGVGVALFASQIVRYILGTRWQPATDLIAVFGLTSASHQLGFNWNAFYNARGNTRPLLVVTVAVMVSFLASAIPLTIGYGLDGMGYAVVVMTVVGLVARTYYLVRLFPGFRMFAHVVRATGPTVPAVGVTLLMRAGLGYPHSALAAAAEVLAYVVVTLGATWFMERALLREVLGYLRSPSMRVSGDPTAFA